MHKHKNEVHKIKKTPWLVAMQQWKKTMDIRLDYYL